CLLLPSVVEPRTDRREILCWRWDRRDLTRQARLDSGEPPQGAGDPLGLADKLLQRSVLGHAPQEFPVLEIRVDCTVIRTHRRLADRIDLRDVLRASRGSTGGG